MDNLPKQIALIPPGTEPLRGLIAIAGPSNSGKTFSALRMANGIRDGLRSDKGIAMLDTEKRGNIYERNFKYDRYNFDPPYSPKAFMEAFRYLDARYSVIICDNYSDEHEGIGGLQEIAASSTNPNDVGKWKDAKAWNKELMNAVKRMDAQYIFLLRATDKIKPPLKGQREPERLGWQPVCEKNFEYDVTMGWMLPPHSAGRGNIWKSIEGFHFEDGVQITEAYGHAIARWIKGEPFSLGPIELIELVVILDETGAEFYKGSIFNEAVIAYREVKRRATDKVKAQDLNLEALKILVPNAKDLMAKNLQKEIDDIEDRKEKL